MPRPQPVCPSAARPPISQPNVFQLEVAEEATAKAVASGPVPIEAVEDVEKIAAVPGIDCLLVGSSDLSMEMGIPGDTGNPKVQAAVDKVIAACAKHGKWPGMGGAYTARPDSYQTTAELVAGIKKGWTMRNVAFGLLKAKRLNPFELIGGHRCKDRKGVAAMLKKAREIEGRRESGTA